MTEYKHADRWLLALFAILLITAAGVWAYQNYGLTLPPLGYRQWTAIVIVTLILAGKMVLKGLFGKEFKLHEQGPEMSLMSLAVALPTTADYFVSKTGHPWLWSGYSAGSIVALFVALLFSKSAEQQLAGSKAHGVYSALSMGLGATSFLFYVFLVVLKTG